MKFAVVFAAIFAVAAALPAGPNDQVLRSDSDVGLTSYKYGYETNGGIQAEEAGEVKYLGQENEAIAVRGSFSYQGDDGQVYTVNYVADENGFQPQAAHLPVAPSF